MNEKWTQWKPIANLSKKYYVESLSNGIDGFKLKLFDEKNRNQKVLIFFPDSVDCYRDTNESFLVITLYNLQKNYGTEFYSEWTFFEIENSLYLDSIQQESSGISDSYKLRHFCLLTINSMVDILADYEPNVTFITEDDTVKNSEKSNSSDIESIGKVGILADGRIVNVRNISNDSRPTLEIYDPKTETSIKTRYGNKPETL